MYWFHVILLIVCAISASTGFSAFSLQGRKFAKPNTKVKYRKTAIFKSKYDDNYDDEDDIPGYSEIFDIPGELILLKYLTA